MYFGIFLFLYAVFISILELMDVKLLSLKKFISYPNIFYSNIICGILIISAVFTVILWDFPFKEYGSVPFFFLFLVITTKYFCLKFLIKETNLPLFKISVFMNCISFLPSIIFLWSIF